MVRHWGLPQLGTIIYDAAHMCAIMCLYCVVFLSVFARPLYLSSTPLSLPYFLLLPPSPYPTSSSPYPTTDTIPIHPPIIGVPPFDQTTFLPPISLSYPPTITALAHPILLPSFVAVLVVSIIQLKCHFYLERFDFFHYYMFLGCQIRI